MTAQSTRLVSVLVLCVLLPVVTMTPALRLALSNSHIYCVAALAKLDLRVEAGVQQLPSLAQSEAAGCSSVSFSWIQTFSCSEC